MTRRGWIGGMLGIVCVAELGALWAQRGQLASLRAEHDQLLAQQEAKSLSSTGLATAPESASAEIPRPRLVVTPELLRLRNEVTRLTERRLELAGVRAENDRLRAEVASRGTNANGGLRLPPGYVRKSEARMVGYGTPEDTLQSLLWAVQNHDLTNLLQAFAPEVAPQVRAQAGESVESRADFWSKSAALVGLRIVKRDAVNMDGSIMAEVELLPGMPPEQITFRQTNGQWKLSTHF
jgi:hypothetical protein